MRPAKSVSLQLSLVINAFLGCALLYIWGFSDRCTIVIEPSEEVKTSPFFFSSQELSHIAESCSKMSDEELFSLVLQPPRSLALGCTSVDLAASVLYSRGVTLDVPLKAAQRWPQSIVPVEYSTEAREKATLNCFSALSEADIASIRAYLLREKAPYTPKRLFFLLKESGGHQATIRESFQRSYEWHQMKHFMRPFLGSDDKVLSYSLLLSWEGVLEHISYAHRDASESQIQGQNPSLQTVMHLLVSDFMRTKSPVLAHFILSVCPARELKKGSSGVIAALFQAVSCNSAQDSRSILMLASEIAQNPSSETLFQEVRSSVARMLNNPQIAKLPRKEFALFVESMIGNENRAGSFAHTREDALNGMRNSYRHVAMSSEEKNHAQSSEQSLPSAKAEASSSAERKKEPAKSPEPKTQKKTTASQSISVSKKVVLSESSQVARRQAQEKISPYLLYTVRKGDTLWSISKRFGVSIDKIRYLNRIKGTTLPPGAVLKIPKSNR